MRRTGIVTILLLVSVALAVVPAYAQFVAYSDDEGNEVRISGQFQVQARTSSCSGYPFPDGDSACENDVPVSELFLRRARIVVLGSVKGWVDFKFQPDFSEINTVVLLDAYARLNFSDEARLTIGRMKRPFDGFQLTSSSQILTIERDVDIPGIPSLTAVSLDELSTDNRFADRDIGLQLDGALSGFHYWIGTFSGSGGENEEAGNGKQLVGRAQYTFDLGGLPLDIALAGSLNDTDFENPDETLGTRLTSSYELWTELGDFDEGPMVQAALVGGKNTNQTVDGDEPDFTMDPDLANLFGWQVIGGWKFSVGNWLEAWQPILRFTYGDPNTALPDDGGWAMTPGVQFFFFDRTKVALNWDIIFPNSDAIRSETSFKAQFQLYF